MKPTDEEIKIAIDFVNSLFSEWNFERIYEAYHPDNDLFLRYDFYDWTREYRKKLTDYCACVCGASRAVFLPNALKDWVIKCDLPHSDCALNLFCERELHFYELSVQKGFSRSFAEMYFLNEIHGVKFFLQKRYEVKVEKTSDSFTRFCKSYYEQEYEEEKSSRFYSCYVDEMDINEVLCALYENIENWDYIDNLFSFMIGLNIDDIHSANVGYDEDDYPVLIDYAGYSFA